MLPRSTDQATLMPMPSNANPCRDGDRRHSADWVGPVTLRQAETNDAGSLKRLAQLDSRPLPPGPLLIAEREGRVDAALSLSNGETVADPFRATGELCELLRSRATALSSDRDRSRGEPIPARSRLATT
jgi:hypothetical protein